jgi:hypothetical protein
MGKRSFGGIVHTCVLSSFVVPLGVVLWIPPLGLVPSSVCLS